MHQPRLIPNVGMKQLEGLGGLGMRLEGLGMGLAEVLGMRLEGVGMRQPEGLGMRLVEGLGMRLEGLGMGLAEDLSMRQPECLGMRLAARANNSRIRRSSSLHLCRCHMPCARHTRYPGSPPWPLHGPCSADTAKEKQYSKKMPYTSDSCSGRGGGGAGPLIV